MANNRMTIILCEGESEYAYIQELNRFLRENEYNLVFFPVYPPIGTGFYSNINERFKEQHKKNPRTPIKILLDDDIYVRSENAREQDNTSKLATCPYKEEFLFNTHNFEDFLMLHCDDETLNQWLTKCIEHNHENVPMHSEEYEPLVNDFFPGYAKGSFPFSAITQGMLDNLFRHNEDSSIFIKSDFASYLKELLNNSK